MDHTIGVIEEIPSEVVSLECHKFADVQMHSSLELVNLTPMHSVSQTCCAPLLHLQLVVACKRHGKRLCFVGHDLAWMDIMIPHSMLVSVFRTTNIYPCLPVLPPYCVGNPCLVWERCGDN
ncbi:hypothetical protein H2248_003242 [Termitomyces sp. 'cryptogamus']|nr:hypothetical protein H2248_003242 [Termitomyces sp. 'cryptogamus']